MPLWPRTCWLCRCATRKVFRYVDAEANQVSQDVPPAQGAGQGATRLEHHLRRVWPAGDGQAWISARQIEAARRAITNYLKRGGKVWIRIFPDKPVTQKPAETRMGSGKGKPEYWVAVVKPGRIMFEISGVPQDRAEEALRRAAMKMPMKCKFVTKPEVGTGETVKEELAS